MKWHAGWRSLLLPKDCSDNGEVATELAYINISCVYLFIRCHMKEILLRYQHFSGAITFKTST
jgi:hypothetical protein